MKVALCLSGQPRSFEAGFKFHERNLLKLYNVDVYMHTWDYVNPNVLDELMALYGGDGRMAVLNTSNIDQKVLTKVDEKYERIPSRKFPARNTYSMLYSIKESIDMVSPIMHTYDVIVRSRYDFALNIIPPLDDTRVNTVYVPDDRFSPEHDFCADMFAWGTPNVMMKYAKTFDNLDRLYAEQGRVFIGEELLSQQLKNVGLTGRNMAYVDMENPFPPGPHNGNWHSFLRDDYDNWR